MSLPVNQLKEKVKLNALPVSVAKKTLSKERTKVDKAQKPVNKLVVNKVKLRYAKNSLIAVVEVTEDNQYVQFTVCKVS